MNNRYLTKIALNRFEKHLAEQPKGKIYADPRITRAKGVMDHRAMQRQIVEDMEFLGAQKSAIKAHKIKAENAMIGVRGNHRSLNKVHRDNSGAFPFANTGDSLSRNSEKTFEQRKRAVKKQKFERVRNFNENLKAEGKPIMYPAQTQVVKPQVGISKLVRQEAKADWHSQDFKTKLKTLIGKAFNGVKSRPGLTAGLTAGLALGGAGLGYGAYKLSKKD